MLLALQLIKMPFSRPENGIFFLRKAVHLTSICIIRNRSLEGSPRLLMVDSSPKFGNLIGISHLSLNILFYIQARH